MSSQYFLSTSKSTHFMASILFFHENIFFSDYNKSSHHSKLFYWLATRSLYYTTWRKRHDWSVDVQTDMEETVSESETRREHEKQFNNL